LENELRQKDKKKSVIISHLLSRKIPFRASIETVYKSYSEHGLKITFKKIRNYLLKRGCE
jgi:hypothetical protein